MGFLHLAHTINIDQDHVQNVSDISRKGSSYLTQVKHADEEPAPEDVENKSDQLDPQVDLDFELGGQELSRRIEERLRVDTRDKHDAVPACNDGDLRILA